MDVAKPSPPARVASTEPLTRSPENNFRVADTPFIILQALNDMNAIPEYYPGCILGGSSTGLHLKTGPREAIQEGVPGSHLTETEER